jgi:hypothetical protein
MLKKLNTSRKNGVICEARATAKQLTTATLEEYRIPVLVFLVYCAWFPICVVLHWLDKMKGDKNGILSKNKRNLE